jgi:hypothetical protein
MLKFNYIDYQLAGMNVYFLSRINSLHLSSLNNVRCNQFHFFLLPPSEITLHSVFGQSQIFQILTKHIGKTINNYETKHMQYENIFYDNFNYDYFIL